VNIEQLFKAVQAFAVNADPDVPMLAFGAFAIIAHRCEGAGEVELTQITEDLIECGVQRTTAQRYVEVLGARRRSANPLGLVIKIIPDPNDRTVNLQKRSLKLSTEGRKLARLLKAL
jgi:hypothetical protein